jgi:hypothetical protein
MTDRWSRKANSCTLGLDSQLLAIPAGEIGWDFPLQRDQEKIPKKKLAKENSPLYFWPHGEVAGERHVVRSR